MSRFVVVWVAVCASVCSQVAFAADNCMRSREYLLSGIAGDLVMPVAAYASLFKLCTAAAAMPNVKDAYMLRDGGIAVTPKQDSISATAATLSQFCESNPRATLRFLTKRDLKINRSISDIVKISSTSAASCKKLRGLD